jgi:hypothetical protein
LGKPACFDHLDKYQSAFQTVTRMLAETMATAPQNMLESSDIIQRGRQ